MGEVSKYLPLQGGIVYGPVNSRRLGRSLGINLLPRELKLCAFNCVYCQYGPTTMSGFLLSPIEPESLVAPGEVERAVRSALRLYPDVQYITFSGNGEPTHHPRFPEIVRRVTAVRNEMAPEALVAVLSNSTGVVDVRILRALEGLDRPIMKLDAGSERCFVQVNRPHPSVSFDAVVKGLSELKHPNLTIQTMLFSGDPDNSTDEDIDSWTDLIVQIDPSEVQIYTIQRSPATPGIFPLAKSLLDDIAARAHMRTGITVRAY